MAYRPCQGQGPALAPQPWPVKLCGLAETGVFGHHDLVAEQHPACELLFEPTQDSSLGAASAARKPACVKLAVRG